MWSTSVHLLGPPSGNYGEACLPRRHARQHWLSVPKCWSPQRRLHSVRVARTSYADPKYLLSLIQTMSRDPSGTICSFTVIWVFQLYLRRLLIICLWECDWLWPLWREDVWWLEWGGRICDLHGNGRLGSVSHVEYLFHCYVR